MPVKEAPFIRFNKSYTINKNTNCWEWNKTILENGYGQIKCFGKMISAHRFSYSLYNGFLTDGLEVMHQCDNPKCVNPEHLTLGTHKENIEDAKNKGRVKKGKDHPFFGKEKLGNPNSQSIYVFVKGIAYCGINYAEICLNVGKGTVRYWIKNKPHLAKIITEKEYKKWHTNTQKI